jgi:hypothetical protein
VRWSESYKSHEDRMAYIRELFNRVFHSLAIQDGKTNEICRNEKFIKDVFKLAQLVNRERTLVLS